MTAESEEVVPAERRAARPHLLVGGRPRAEPEPARPTPLRREWKGVLMADLLTGESAARLPRSRRLDGAADAPLPARLLAGPGHRRRADLRRRALAVVMALAAFAVGSVLAWWWS